MRLKKIKLAGFKSFVDPTTVPFTGNLTAIVGPNGCGKSNVIDAVRWVLGESSAKHLRGDAMTDVIFNGSSQRKPVSQASIELVFDNSEGRMGGSFAQYNEVSVKRQVNREAQASYYLNGTKCRKRDITDLFLGTGLGPRSYAIIEQGMISRLIESRPQELRVYIEEAAGISKYKERRRETENRLRHTKENLERLLDVREELGNQLDKLQRQAAAAKRYKSLRQEERSYKAELAAIRYLKLQEQTDASQKASAANQTELTGLQSQYVMLERQQTEMQTRLGEQQLKQEREQQQLYQLGNQIARTEQQILHQAQQKQRLQQEQEQLAASLAEQTEFLHANRDEIAMLEEENALHLQTQEELSEQLEVTLEQTLQVEAELEQWNERWQQASRSHTDVQKQLAHIHSRQQLTEQLRTRALNRQQTLQEGLQTEDVQSESELFEPLELEIESLSEQILMLEEQLAHSREEKQRLGDEKQVLQSQLRMTNEQKQRIDAKAETLQQWVSQHHAQHNEQMLALGISGLGPVTDQLVVDTGWEKAVETVLEQFLDAEHVANIPQLDNSPGARLAIVASEAQFELRPGTLAEKLSGNDPLRAITNNVFVADSYQQAVEMLSALPDAASVVSADGIWQGKGWSIYPGEARGELVSRQELDELQQQSEQLQQQVERFEELQLVQQEKIDNCSEQIAASQHQMESAKRQHSDQRHQLELTRQRWQSEQQRINGLRHELQEVQSQLAQHTEELELLSESLLELESQDQETQEHQLQLQQGREEQVNQLAHQRALLERLKAEHHKAALHIEGGNERIRSLHAAEQRAQAQVAELKARQERLSDEVSSEDEPEIHQIQLEEMLENRLMQETKLSELSDLIGELQQQLIDTKQSQQQIFAQQQQLREVQSSLQLEQEGLKVRAEGQLEQLEDLEVRLHDILAQLDSGVDESVHQEALDRVGRAISRLGAINLAAIDEFEQQSERKRYLDGQYDDLSGAIETLESAIRRIDRECKTRFKDTFDKVNTDLKQLFPKVFGGGAAYLELTDDDLLETGVTIMARPPGKRNATIHLLSGGEKALTALSLVFAIFRLNPAPFCMLDEVDAPLDDANVGRYCNLVKEMSNSVQFVYISHNKVSMEMAEQLSGVTMLEPGVSRLVSVDVDEAVALAEVS